jgi:hypothetical protein
MKILKENYIIYVAICAVFILLGTGLIPPLQTATATDMLNDEHSLCTCNYQFMCSVDGDTVGCKALPNDDTLENLTREEIARLACDPDYFTPERITLPEYFTSLQQTQGSVMMNEKDVEVTICTESSSTNLGDKITANGATYDIKLNDEIVGGLVFNKTDQYIIIIIISDVTVDVLWNCASKYATCTLDGMGVYKIPQLLQDNGKPQSFNAIWITNVKQGTPILRALAAANPKPIKTLILIDEEAEAYFNKPTWAQTCAQANNILEGGDDYLEVPYGLDFQTVDYQRWASPNNMNYTLLLREIADNFPANNNYDVVVLMTGQADIGSNYIGLARLMGNHFVMDVDYGTFGLGHHHGTPLANLFHHEASHLFNCLDHDPGYTALCIMSYFWDSSLRSYCSNCQTALWRNQLHYNIVGYVNGATVASTGNGYVSDKDAIQWMGVNGSFARLNSGSLGNKAVLNVRMVNKYNQYASLSGNVQLRGYSGSSLGNHLIVYSSNDNVNWVKILDTNVYTNGPSGEFNIDCGYVSNVQWLSIVVYNDYNYVGDVYLNKAHILL